MAKGTLVIGIATLLSFAGLTLMSTPALAFTPGNSTTAPFNECPAVGDDTSCGLLFVINPDGSVSVLVDGSQGPYDGIEDTLIGVLNQSSQTIPSLTLTSTNGAFGFDGDGICNFGAPGCPYSTTNTGYEGPDNTFTVTDANHGTVNFINSGLTPGASTYFSLEGTVTPQSLEFPLAAQATTINAVEGQTFTAEVATFTDPDASDPNDSAANDTAKIDWGDGSGTTVGSITSTGNGHYTVSGTHTYADEGAYTVNVSISDPDDPGGPAMASSSATVADAALAGANGAAISGTEGQAISNATVATFTDANPGATTADFTSGGGSVTVDWGDSTTSAGTVTQTGPGAFAVSGSHTYVDEGSYTIKVSVVDDGGSTTSASDTAAVADAALAATGVPAFVSTNPVSQTLATFTDANPLATTADFTSGGGSVTINWGDSTTSAGTLTQTGPGAFSVSGSHTYAALGPYTITINIVDDGGSTATATTHVIVFAYASDGSFVIGQGNGVGSSVTFWSAQWNKDNTVSGGTNAFKGFENSTAMPQCPGTWTSDPGNSASPPATIPTYMAVIVSSKVSKSGSAISGDIQEVVIVATNAGYGPDPGHAGTGTVVAVLCGG